MLLYRTGLLATFALWWYMELLPKQDLCENSDSFFRAVPRDFRTGDPTLDSDVATCEGYMAYGTDLFGQQYNHTLCAQNFTLITHKYAACCPSCLLPNTAPPNLLVQHFEARHPNALSWIFLYACVLGSYMTYAKACPRTCGTCNEDLALLATETAAARSSALLMSIVLVFCCGISGLLCRNTPVGEYASAHLEAYEGNDESLQQWKDIRDLGKLPFQS